MALRLGADTLAHEGRFLRTVHREVTGLDGRAYTWELIERKTHGPIVAVVAETAAHELIMLRVFRVPLRGYVLEFPAGLMDKDGEDPETCALRELREETGYEAPRAELLFRGPYNAGLTADEIAVFYAPDAKRVGAPEREPLEDMELLEFPAHEFAKMLHAPPANTSVDPKLFATLYFLEKRGVTKAR
jgi:8-oxo-dGTP pyrophosphatase MutT (NUDIX family)